MKNPLDWFKSKKLTIIKMVFTGMDLKTWRETPEFLSFARDLWSKPQWQHALSALRNAAPSGYPLRGGRAERPISDIEAAIELGRKEGYQDCLNAVFSLAIRAPAAQVEVEADFDPRVYPTSEIEMQ
jgi:hypothetical protein